MHRECACTARIPVYESLHALDYSPRHFEEVPQSELVMHCAHLLSAAHADNTIQHIGQRGTGTTLVVYTRTGQQRCEQADADTMPRLQCLHEHAQSRLCRQAYSTKCSCLRPHRQRDVPVLMPVQGRRVKGCTEPQGVHGACSLLHGRGSQQSVAVAGHNEQYIGI